MLASRGTWNVSVFVKQSFQKEPLLSVVKTSCSSRFFASGDESAGSPPDNFLKKLQQIGLRELTEITSKYQGLRTDVRSKAEKEEDTEDVQDAEDSDINKTTGERGGPKGPEPTRYGDWAKAGRVSDF